MPTALVTYSPLLEAVMDTTNNSGDAVHTVCFTVSKGTAPISIKSQYILRNGRFSGLLTVHFIIQHNFIEYCQDIT